MASASWGLFFLPSAQMYKKEGCGPAMQQATQSQSCGQLSVALTRPKFLLPHSLETWRFIIAVVCLRLLWLPYLSQKKSTNKPKQNQKTHTRLGTLSSSNVSRLTVTPGFLWRLWGRTHPGNGWHFLACGQITLMVTVTHGISPVCASKGFLFVKLSDCLESHSDDFILISSTPALLPNKGTPQVLWVGSSTYEFGECVCVGGQFLNCNCLIVS